MSSKARRLRKWSELANIGQQQLEDAQQGEDKEFARRLEALLLFGAGATASRIKRDTGICRQECDRYATRLQTLGIDSLQYCQRGDYASMTPEQIRELEPRVRGPRYELGQYFRKFPDDLTVIKRMALEPFEDCHGTKVEHTAMQLLAALRGCARKRGIKEGSFPLIEDDPPLRPVRRLMDKFRLLRDIEEEKRKAAVAETLMRFFPVRRPRQIFDSGTFDGHAVPVKWKVRIPSKKAGLQIVRKVSGIYWNPVIEDVTDAILGQSIAWGTNYGSHSFCQTFRDALVSSPDDGFILPGVNYPGRAMLPNQHSIATALVCLNRVNVDGASAHVAASSRAYLRRTHGCEIIVGPAGSPNIRPSVENMFGQFDAAVVRLVAEWSRRLMGTAPDGDADGYVFTDVYIVIAIIKWFTRAWNNAIIPGTTERRNDALERIANGPSLLLRRLVRSQQEFVNNFDLCFAAELGVNGNLFWGDEYYNFPGGPRRQLAGTPILVCGRSNDVRKFTIFKVDTNEKVGQVQVGPKFINTPHTLWARDLAKGLAGSDFSLMAGDMTYSLRDQLASKVADGTAPAYQLNRLLDEQASVMSGEGAIDDYEEATKEGGTSSVQTLAPDGSQQIGVGGSSPRAGSPGERQDGTLINDDVRARLKRLGSSY